MRVTARAKTVRTKIEDNEEYVLTKKGKRIAELLRMGIEQPLLIFMLEQRFNFKLEIR